MIDITTIKPDITIFTKEEEVGKLNDDYYKAVRDEQSPYYKKSLSEYVLGTKANINNPDNAIVEFVIVEKDNKVKGRKFIFFENGVQNHHKSIMEHKGKIIDCQKVKKSIVED